MIFKTDDGDQYIVRDEAIAAAFTWSRVVTVRLKERYRSKVLAQCFTPQVTFEQRTTLTRWPVAVLTYRSGYTRRWVQVTFTADRVMLNRQSGADSTPHDVMRDGVSPDDVVDALDWMIDHGEGAR